MFALFMVLCKHTKTEDLIAFQPDWSVQSFWYRPEMVYYSIWKGLLHKTPQFHVIFKLKMHF